MLLPQYYYEIKAKKITACQSPIIILCLLYTNDLLLLTLTLVAKSFSSSYKELSSATSNSSRGLNERREQQKTTSPRFCRCFRLFVCVDDDDNNNQRLRQTMTYHVILSSTIVFAADDRYTIAGKGIKIYF
jgi:hypothetical protein